MKVYLQYDLNDSGKGKFLQRLIPELSKLGVEVSNNKRADICLGMSKWRDEIPDMPRVLRIDGIYFRRGKKEDWRNNEIRKSIKKAHAVIFQSHWYAKEVCRLLKVTPKRTYVIHNGAPKMFSGEKNFNKKYNVLFVSNWGTKKERKDKHLKWHVQVAEKLLHRKDIQFWLIGPTPMKIENTKNMVVVGNLENKELIHWYCNADLLVYLSTPDCCPNTVVECLCSGTPVLCMKGCGVEEIVEPDGGWAQERLDLIPQNIEQMLESYREANRPDLYIENIAKQYKEAFENVLCKA